MTNQLILEEIANSITHGIGSIFAVVGMIIFFITQLHTSDMWRVIGFSIFATSLILMYIISTLSHSLVFTKARKVFEILDHSAIFLLIAGTYTYFLLTTLRTAQGWSLLGIVWALSIAGIILKAYVIDRLKFVSLGMYLLLGWLIVIVLKPLIHAIPLQIFILLLLGGIFYSLGTIFYSAKRLPFSHAIWHLFVIGGSLCHFLAVYLL